MVLLFVLPLPILDKSHKHAIHCRLWRGEGREKNEKGRRERRRTKRKGMTKMLGKGKGRMMIRNRKCRRWGS